MALYYGANIFQYYSGRLDVIYLLYDFSGMSFYLIINRIFIIVLVRECSRIVQMNSLNQLNYIEIIPRLQGQHHILIHVKPRHSGLEFVLNTLSTIPGNGYI